MIAAPDLKHVGLLQESGPASEGGGLFGGQIRCEFWLWMITNS